MKKILGILIGLGIVLKLCATTNKTSEVQQLFIDINKHKIIDEIKKIDDKKFKIAYDNVIEQLREEKNTKGVRLLEKEKTYSRLKKDYHDMLSAVAKNESNFKYKIGLYDKFDISYFQINIRTNIWSINKLSALTKEKVTKNSLLNDIHHSAFVALHILLYNITIYSNFHKLDPSKEKTHILVATYNNPFKLKSYYIRKAKKFLATI